jgi:hypothetical protein
VPVAMSRTFRGGLVREKGERCNRPSMTIFMISYCSSARSFSGSSLGKW